MKKEYNIIIESDNSGKRIDVAISNEVPEISRSSIKTHLLELTVNHKKEKLSYKCREGDNIFIALKWDDMDNIIPEKIPLDIIYEDNNYIIVNKKHDMVVHPAKGNIRGTLVNALLGMKKELSESIDNFRPGIVHRLDKETSGLIIITKNIKAHEYISGLFRNRNIIKKYHAIVKGFFIPSKTIIENHIGRHPIHRKKMAVLKKGGKESITIVENTIHYKDYSFLDIKLKTGRTHQIRVHLSNLGYPILGDTIYGRKDKLFSEVPLCLVAYKIVFDDIFTKKKLEFTADDPEHMKSIIKKIT